MEDKTLTPKPASKPLTMNFPDAMRRVINKEKVRRISWGNADYCFLDVWLSIFTKGKINVWKINDGDMEGNDWVVVLKAN